MSDRLKRLGFYTSAGAPGSLVLTEQLDGAALDQFVADAVRRRDAVAGTAR